MEQTAECLHANTSSLNAGELKARVNLQFCKKFKVMFLWEFLRVSVTVSSMIVFPKWGIFAFEKRSLEKGLSNWADIFRICLVFVEDMHLKHIVDFPYHAILTFLCLKL